MPVISVLLFLFSFAIYSLGLPGGFEFDDGSNIVENKRLFVNSLSSHDLLNAAFSSPAGPLSRPVAMVSFAVNYYVTGLDAPSFKIVNIFIHALNAVLVLFLSRAIFRRLLVSDRQILMVSVASAAMWSLAPINLTSVLYVVQRMTSLGALFALLALLSWMSGRTCMEKGLNGQIWFHWTASVLFTVLAILTKETYVLIFLCVVLLEWCLFQRTMQSERLLGWIFASAGCTSIVVCAGWLFVHPEAVLDPYDYRSFTLRERVLTQFRVLCFYLVQVVFPSNIKLGLYHDDFTVSTSLIQPFSTLASVVTLGVLVTLSIWFRKSALLGMGILWFLVWHVIESTIIGLELVHEHRNYLASLGIIWVLAYGAQQLQARKLFSQSVLVLLFVCATTYWGAILALRAIEWSGLEEHAVAEVMHHPHSVRAKYQLGRIHTLKYLNSRDLGHLLKAETAYREAAAMSDYDLLPLFGLVRSLLWQKKPYEESLRELENKLESAKIPASTNAALDNYLACILAGECVELAPAFSRLVKRAIDNPTVKGRSKSQLVNILASYYYEFERSPALAEAALMSGLGILPQDFDLNKNLMYFYIVEGKMQAAEETYRDIVGRDLKLPVDGRQQLDIACRKIKASDPSFEC